MRVHELAKELKLSSKELLEKLEKLGIEAKNHMARLDEKAITRVKAGLKAPKKTVQSEKPALAKPVPAKPAPAARPAVSSVKKTEVKKAEPQKPETARSEPKTPAPVVPLPLAPPPPSVPATAVVERIRLEYPISVGTLAARLSVKVSELIKALMDLGVFANVNQLLGEEVVLKLGAKLGIPVERIPEEPEEKIPKSGFKKPEEKNAKTRPPVVTLMGHVDHGKTSLLDAIRKTNVAEKEAGRITQHIGAYGVDLPGKGHVTFLDTPGHEAFTAMRARGANITDVVVLVVAADDGVMPQTIEAMDHAREAGVPIVVAVNKCDLPQANPQKVMMQLQKLELVSEEWGGKTIFCKVSAKTGEGIEHLLEMLLLEAEVLELKANPDIPAEGTVVESRLTKGVGPVATVIVRKGTLRVSDVVIAGPYFGRVRALQNDRGKRIKEAGPSYAAEVHGLNGVPEAGEILRVAEDEKTARRISEKRSLELRERVKQGAHHLTLEDLHARIKEGAVKELKLIIKADVQGSVEALAQSLEKLSDAAVRLRVIHGGVGGPNESDVMLAAASDAVIIGFHVKAEPRAIQTAEAEGVEIRSYEIIYEAVEDVRKAMEGLLEPVYQEVLEGRAEVKKVFRSSKVGAVGGSHVSKGKITRSSKVRLLRAKSVIFDGKLASLKRFKDDVREVAEGYEFGFILEGSSDLQEGDILEAFRLEKTTAPRPK